MIVKQPCLDCGSTDNLTTHHDGGIWCYTPNCPGNLNRNKGSFINTQGKITANNSLIEGTFSAIPARRISQRTCEFFNYQVGVDNGEPVQIANYEGGCQQIRTKDKKFYFKGDTSKLTLWGKQKWNNNSRFIIITEGQIDALSIAECQDCKWPVVSLPNGAGSARKSIQSELDWLLGFGSIILCFDNDDAGRSAILSCVDLFPPGKLKIASLSEKDANDCLTKGKIEELTKIVFNAQEYRPDGLIALKDIKVESLFKKKKSGYRICYPILNDAMRGLPPGRITTFYGLTGRGKTTTFKEIILGLTADYPKVKIAGIFLEENVEVTNEYLVAMRHSIAAWKIKENSNLLTEDQKKESHKMLSNVYLYDHFGSIDPKRLINILEYMAVSLGVEIVILDHLSMIFSGIESGREGERKDIDTFMTLLRSMVERTGLHVITATQLKRRNRDKDSEGDEIITEEDARGCVDNKTEFLTPFGWKKISEYDKGDQVAIYTKDGYIQYEQASFLKKKADKFYHLKSVRGIDQVVSPEHRLIFQWGSKGRNNNIQEQTVEKFVNSHIESSIGHRGRFRTTFNTDKEEIIGKQLEFELRLWLAYQADGTYSTKRPRQHIFKFKKDRKYDRLKYLLSQAQIEFKDYGKFPCGQYCIETNLPYASKDLNFGFNITRRLAEIVIDEIKYWDGELTTGAYFSTNQLNANFVQYCYALCGIRAIVTVVRSKKITQKDVYRVRKSNNNTVCLANKDKKPLIEEYQNHDGFKYCFTTSTGYWIARRNGRIFITGNSGSIEHISDYIIFLNRNKRGDHPNRIKLELYKNRYTGHEGMMDELDFDRETGRLLPKQERILSEEVKNNIIGKEMY